MLEKFLWVAGCVVTSLGAWLALGRSGNPPAQRVPLAVSEFIFTQAPFAEGHASTLVELADGDLLAAWFGGPSEGDPSVAIWGARRHGGVWSPPEELARQPGVPCWNPVLFRVRQSRVWLFYKLGKSPESWSGAYRTSTDGRTWSEVTYLPAGLLGPTKNKPITLTCGEIVAGTSVESYGAWTCWVEIISNPGEAWQRFGPITVPGVNRGIIQPTLWEVRSGVVKMLTRSTRQIGLISEATSTDGGRTWSAARPTALPNPNSGIDAVKLQDGRVALAYNHTRTGRSPLNLAVSPDDGETWGEPLVLEDEAGEFSYPAIIQTREGMIHLTYTWNRRRIKHVAIDPAVVPASSGRKAK